MAVHRKNSRFSAAQQRCGGFMACYAAKETSPGLLTAPMFTFLPFKVKPLPVSRKSFLSVAEEHINRTFAPFSST